MNATAHIIGNVKRIRPRYIVNNQLNTLTPVGMATTMVAMAKNVLTSAPAPIVKKWCTQVRKPTTLMAKSANTMDPYPNVAFRENVEMTSESTPNAGRITIYTSG